MRLRGQTKSWSHLKNSERATARYQLKTNHYTFDSRSSLL